MKRSCVKSAGAYGGVWSGSYGFEGAGDKQGRCYRGVTSRKCVLNYEAGQGENIRGEA